MIQKENRMPSNETLTKPILKRHEQTRGLNQTKTDSMLPTVSEERLHRILQDEGLNAKNMDSHYQKLQEALHRQDVR